MSKTRAGAFVLLGFALAAPIAFHSRPESAVPAVLVLEKAQALGELHTAQYTYSQVLEHRTSRSAPDWAQALPGAQAVVVGLTENKALISATIEVEAGVDLGKVRLVGDTLTLPKPRLYRPTVHAVLHEHRPGVAWRDTGIALEAEREASARATQAAKESGILSRATEEAERRVSVLARSLGSSVTVVTGH